MSRSPATVGTSRRLSRAPAEVFAAFERPDLLAVRRAPSGFTTEFEFSSEYREGGGWTFDMAATDGARHPNRSEFLRLGPGVQAVIRHESAPGFTLAVDLEPAPKGTRLARTQTFDDPAVAAAVRHILEPASEQYLGRLRDAPRAPGCVACPRTEAGQP